MWITKITFRVNVELTTDNFYFEIKEIKFLRNNTDEKADLNTLDVRKKEFRFTNEYFDQMATDRLSQTFEIEGLTYIDFWYDIDTKQGTINLGFKGLSLDNFDNMVGEIIFPESVTLQYYQNRELKTGELKIADIFVDSFMLGEYGYQPTHIKTNLYIQSEYIHEVEYVEGTKVCKIGSSDNSYKIYNIPSTCEEIYTNYVYNSNKIRYNGTIEDFNNIKGAQELISQLESLVESFGETYTIICTNGKITNSRWP